MTKDDEIGISKILSLALRHQPDVLGIVLDEYGRAYTDAVLQGLQTLGHIYKIQDLEYIVMKNDKKRFVLNNEKKLIRANQGHSVPVDLGLSPSVPPHTLYHGTVKRNLLSIFDKGLLPGKRQYVHLSVEKEPALAVGKRYGSDSVVLDVDAVGMYNDGHLLYVSKNGIWLTAHVFPQYIIRNEIV